MSTTLFQVTIQPQVNEEELNAITFSSEQSYDHCYERISKYLNEKCKKNEWDKIAYNILHTSSVTYND